MPNLAAVLHGPDDVRIEERAMTAPAPGEVIVRICGSDVHYSVEGRIGKFVVEAPMVIVHEASGMIVGVGDGVDATRIGERVALQPGVPDGTCAQCRAGHYNLCSEVPFFATPPYDGAIADHVALDARFAHPVPDSLDLEHAALAEPVSVRVAAARRASVKPGDRAVVTGAGLIGLLAGLVARAFGVTHVVLTDTNDNRLAVAREQGFTAVPAGQLAGEEFDVPFECSGWQAALTDGISHLERRARVVLIGMGADPIGLNLPLTQQRELTISGVFRYAHTYPLAIQLLASGAIDGASVITHRVPLQETAVALSLNRREPESLKVMVIVSS